MKAVEKNSPVRNAFLIGGLCAVAYLAAYIARNVLGTVSPQMIENGILTESQIGTLSSIYFISYAVGQLINGAIGDKIKAKYMISFGLLLAGISNGLFSSFTNSLPVASVAYGLTGFFLSMIYGPMTKLVAENTNPIYAARCSLGYTFSSFLGSPLAGVLAMFLLWDAVFMASSIALIMMGILCFLVFSLFEKEGIITYGRYCPPAENRKVGSGIQQLLQHHILKFTFVSILTGVVRTTVVFWLPTYLSQYLGFSPETAALLFTVSTLVISLSTFVAVFLYERLGRDMNRPILIAFTSSALLFGALYFLKVPVLNILCIVLAILASNCAASVLWSYYCPSLRDTGLVSGATGFLDFVSYMAASISSALFANAVPAIGWKNVILIWFGLMVLGVVVALPYKKRKHSH